MNATTKQLNIDYLMNDDLESKELLHAAYQDYLKDEESDSEVMGIIEQYEVA